MVFMVQPSDVGNIIGAPPDVLHPGAGAAVIRPLVGKQSFMLLEEHEHLAVRKIVMPAFHQSVVEGHTKTVSEIAEREIAGWPADKMFAAHGHLRALTLRVILTTIFGSEDPRLDELHLHLLKMLAVTGSLSLQEPPLRALPRWRSSWESFLTERRHVRRLMEDLIADKVHGDIEESGVLALLLDGRGAGGCAMSLCQVQAHLMSVIVAGHETTASELAWALQVLAHDPRALNTLVDELDRGDEVYLLATVREVMRHRPVFLFTIPRVVARPMELAGKMYVPPVQLVGCIHLMHHDPANFPEPHQFKPERFVDASPDPRVWLPWGGGRRRCVGYRLATLEMQTVLCEVLRQRTLLPASHSVETARWRSVIVIPGHGCRIILNRRKGAMAWRPDGLARAAVLK